MKRKLGDILADMALYGDIEEASHICLTNAVSEGPILGSEEYIRRCLAATLLKLTNGGEGGPCSKDDELVAPYLRQEVEVSE